LGFAATLCINIFLLKFLVTVYLAMMLSPSNELFLLYGSLIMQLLAKHPNYAELGIF
jgi:hypothetical protein